MKMVILYLAIAIIIAVLSFWGISSYHYNKMIDTEIKRIAHPQQKDTLKLFNYSDLITLPAPVQNYLKQSIPDGYPIIRTVELRHGGYFRTKPNGKWWPIKGEEYFQTNRPNYLWIADVSPNPIIWLKARDKYTNGQGEVLVRLYSALTVSKTNDDKVSQSALIRFAGEMPWFPTTFAANPYLRWEPINDHSARAILSDKDQQVSVTYYFNEDNEIERFFTNDRFYEDTKQDYTGYYRKYQEINGIRIPTEVKVEWNLPGGDFSYAHFILSSIVYNKYAAESEIESRPIPAQ